MRPLRWQTTNKIITISDGYRLTPALTGGGFACLASGTCHHKVPQSLALPRHSQHISKAKKILGEPVMFRFLCLVLLALPGLPRAETRVPTSQV